LGGCSVWFGFFFFALVWFLLWPVVTKVR